VTKRYLELSPPKRRIVVRLPIIGGGDGDGDTDGDIDAEGDPLGETEGL